MVSSSGGETFAVGGLPCDGWETLLGGVGAAGAGAGAGSLIAVWFFCEMRGSFSVAWRVLGKEWRSPRAARLCS